MEFPTENGFNNIITNNDFQTTSTRVTKWSDLPVNTIYSIEELKEKIIKKDGIDVTSKYAVLKNRDGEIKNVWLTSIIVEELKKFDIEGEDIVYIKSFGLKTNKAGTRKYYDFDMIARKKL